MLVLHIGLQARRLHGAVAPHGVVELHRMTVVGHRIAGRVPPFPFVDMVGDGLVLSAEAPCELVLPFGPRTFVRESGDAGLQAVAGVLVEDTRAEHIGRVRIQIGDFGVDIARLRIVTALREHIFAGDIESLAFIRIIAAKVEINV